MYLHHLKGLDKFHLDHKKISGLLSILYKNLSTVLPENFVKNTL